MRSPGGSPATGRNVRLRTVPQAPDEPAYLHRIIETIGSGPDLDTILKGVVHLATEATGCHACLIWFVEGGRLALRSSSPPYDSFAGSVSLQIGEGLVGWVAKTRRAAFIRERALEDPRVRYFPEFDEERFQSLVSVPMFDRDGDVMGVISLHAEAPHEFSRSDLELLEHTASLMAGAVENARLYERATHQVRLLGDVSELSRRIASAGAVGDVLRAVVEGVRSLVPAERVEVYLVGSDEKLHLGDAEPPRPDAPSLTDTAELDRGPGGVDPAVVALETRDQRLGVLAVWGPDLAPEAASVLSVVAAHASVAIGQLQTIDALRETNLAKDLFQALAGGGHAAGLPYLTERLGIDLDAPHLVLDVRGDGAAARTRGRPSTSTAPRTWRAAAVQAEARLAARFRGALFDRQEGSMRVIVPLVGEATEEAIAAMREMDWSPGSAAALTVGVSNTCVGSSSFAEGFREAASAAEVGALILGGPGVATYDELGPYRYVLGAEGSERDRFQQALQLAVDYDAKRGTHLLPTLEAYLDHRGNVVATSRALFIHPNTLRQRLERIELVSGLDLEGDDWLSLAVAAKVVKLRQMRKERETAGA